MDGDVDEIVKIIVPIFLANHGEVFEVDGKAELRKKITEWINSNGFALVHGYTPEKIEGIINGIFNSLRCVRQKTGRYRVEENAAMISQGSGDLRGDLSDLDSMGIFDFLNDERDLFGAQAVDEIDETLKRYDIGTVGELRTWTEPELKQMQVRADIRDSWDEYVDLLIEALAIYGASLNESSLSFQEKVDEGPTFSIMQQTNQIPKVSRDRYRLEIMNIAHFLYTERDLLGSSVAYINLRGTLIAHGINTVGKLTTWTEADLKALKVSDTDQVLGDLNIIDDLKAVLLKYGLYLSKEAPVPDKVVEETSIGLFLYKERDFFEAYVAEKIERTLLYHHINTVGKLVKLSKIEVENLYNPVTRLALGITNAKRLESALSRHGFYLKTKVLLLGLRSFLNNIIDEQSYLRPQGAKDNRKVRVLLETFLTPEEALNTLMSIPRTIVDRRVTLTPNGILVTFEMKSSDQEGPASFAMIHSKTMEAGLATGTYGGIDMNAAHLTMNIKRDGNGVPLPVSQQDLENIHIDGLVPVILDIRPIVSSVIFSQLMTPEGAGASG